MYHRLSFGKHKGKRLCDVPASYLLWCLREVDLDAWLRQAILAELKHQGHEIGADYGRQEGASQESTGSPREKSLVDLRSIVKTWFAGLARDWHPDRHGGDGRPMAAINDAAERLRKLVGI